MTVADLQRNVSEMKLHVARMGDSGRVAWHPLEVGKLHFFFLSLVWDVRISRVGCSLYVFSKVLEAVDCWGSDSFERWAHHVVKSPFICSSVGWGVGFLFHIFSSPCLILFLHSPLFRWLLVGFWWFSSPTLTLHPLHCLPVGGVRVCVIFVSCFCSPFSIISIFFKNVWVVVVVVVVGGGGSDGGGVKTFFLTFVAPIVSLLVSRLLACLGQRQKSLVLIHCFPQIIFPSATCCYLVPFGLEWRTLPHSSLCCHSICLPNYYFFLSLSLFDYLLSPLFTYCCSPLCVCVAYDISGLCICTRLFMFQHLSSFMLPIYLKIRRENCDLTPVTIDIQI